MSLIEHARGFMNGIRSSGPEVGADEHTNEPASGESAAPATAGRVADGDLDADLIEEWETQPNHH